MSDRASCGDFACGQFLVKCFQNSSRSSAVSGEQRRGARPPGHSMSWGGEKSIWTVEHPSLCMNWTLRRASSAKLQIELHPMPPRPSRVFFSNEWSPLPNVTRNTQTFPVRSSSVGIGSVLFSGGQPIERYTISSVLSSNVEMAGVEPACNGGLNGLLRSVGYFSIFNSRRMK